MFDFGNWDSNINKEIKDALETNIPCYSLGIKIENYNFKQQRIEEFKNREKELEDTFLENTLTHHIKKDHQKDFIYMMKIKKKI